MATIPTQNPVPSEAAVDLKFNAGKIDEFVTSFVLKYTDRLGRDHLTIEGIRDLVEKAIKAFGFITMDSFEDGATLDNSSQVLRWESNGEYYRWDGSFPKVVPTGSTPATTGGIGTSAWVSIGDAALRSQLSQSTGATLVGYGDITVGVMLDDMAHKSGEEFTGAISAPGITSKTTYGGMVVGDQPVTPPDSLRDAINVSRKIDNSPTNCHGFSDKTWINNASDYGGYGSFDSTVLVSGSNTHNHAYSFQDRINYAGSGTLQNMEGLYSSPSITGTGTVESRMGVFINNAAVTGGGHLLQQNGIFVEDLFSAGTNVGIHVRQTTGFGYYSPNFGKMYQNGVVGFGIEPSQLSTAINWRNGADVGFYGFATTDNNGVSLGATQDTKLQFVSGGEVRLQIKRGTGFNRAVTAGNDNLTPLGDSTNRWGVIYAGTGTINTSDGREKSKPISIDTLSENIGEDRDRILDAWGDVSIIAFQWLASIDKKGHDARWHFGVIAQQVRDVFQQHGMDGTKLGLLCYDEWDDIVDEQSGEVITPTGNRWGIRSDQCAWIEAAYQRRINHSLIERIERLEAILAKD
ncbi:tail fiber/spike domain-containing protein [Yersinia intermedia]|uniref:Peptidase S74 domain-containing protein n=1 Tax=Yersinia intermedia TaxID=631 RepID=A0ABX6F5M3_YERIN|nr:tail fiber domain-containing protein [Yersinia intermedia]QGR65317.1 hypothetical protein FOC38_04750 [Yersinia intermedia]QGR70334.1 hypothetical protein FOC37_08055 [Yersinia intermedia]